MKNKAPKTSTKRFQFIQAGEKPVRGPIRESLFAAQLDAVEAGFGIRLSPETVEMMPEGDYKINKIFIINEPTK